MSKRTVNPRHRILLSDISNELSISQDRLLVLLVELQNSRLVEIHNTTIVSVSLTNYGVENEELPL